MTYSLDFKTSDVWNGDNHVLGSDYRAECLNVKAYQSYKTDPTKQSDSFFRKQNGKCRTWSKEEVRKENIKRKLLKPTIKEYLSIKWDEFKTEWNHPTRNPFWFKCLFLGTCSVSIIASIMMILFPNM